MRALNIRSQRVTLLVALFMVSFALYFVAESGSGTLEVALLGALAALMIVAVLIG